MNCLKCKRTNRCVNDDWLLKRPGPTIGILSVNTGTTLITVYAVDVIQNVEVELATITGMK